MLRRDVPIKKLVIITGRTDMRLGIDSLVSTVRLNYGLDPIEKGTVFLFCGRRKDRLKALEYEGDGFRDCDNSHNSSMCRCRTSCRIRKE